MNHTYVLSNLHRILALPLDPSRSAFTEGSRQTQHRLCESDQTILVDEYLAGRSVYELADRFVITRKTVSAILERHSIRRRYRVLSDVDITKARALYEAGWSLASLADHFGVNPSTVLNAFRRHGIATRPRGTNQWRKSSPM